MQRTLLAAAFSVSILALGTPASAQFGGRPDSNHPGYGDARASYFEARRAAYENGYREGAKEGERDGRRGTFGFQDERTFQRADKGYHREFGDRERYRQSFRNGYVEGYRAAYDRFGRYSSGSRRGPGVGQGRYQYPGQYPGQYGYGQGYGAAYQNGVNDGYEKGLEDARKRRSFDPLRHKWYRSGDRHYNSRYGSREQYSNLYRNGFRQGYEEGYRQRRW
jgi:flagellar biosynthesis/type III secretory pathway protein FliH